MMERCPKVLNMYKAIEAKYRSILLKIVGMPKGFEGYVEEFAKIAVFLQDEKAVLYQLKKLNDLLAMEAEKHNLPIKGQEAGSCLRHNKLLRNVLENELKKMKFQFLAKATDTLPPEVFRFAISEGFLIKDPGAGSDHGEFTHALQWLIIGWQQQDDTQFLNKPVIEIFKGFSDERAVLRNKSTDKEENVWDYVLDNLEANDFRAPEYFNKFILDNNDSNLSTLTELLRSRFIKRWSKEKEEAKILDKPMKPLSFKYFQLTSELFEKNDECNKGEKNFLTAVPEQKIYTNLFTPAKKYPKTEYEKSEKNTSLLIPLARV